MDSTRSSRRLSFSVLPLLATLAGAVCVSVPAAASDVEPGVGAAPRKLSVSECVALALGQNIDVLASQFEIAETEAARDGARGRFGPVVHLDGNALQWNSPFDLPFALPGTPGPLPVLRVRDAFTWSATGTLTQPLTGLLPIYDNYKLKEIGVDVALIRREIVRREVAFRVNEGYYRLAQAMRLGEVAVASVDQLEAARRQAESFHVNGVVGKNDVLRADLAVANAKQRVIQSRGQITIARGKLASLMGMPPDAVIEPLPFTGDPPPRDAGTIEQAESRAVSGRIELRELNLRIEQSDKGVRLAYAKLLPQVNLVGSYQHVEGSAFSQLNAAYVGAAASWDVWDWGTTTNGISEAKARVGQAIVAQNKLQDAIRQDMRQAYVNEATASEAMGVANVAVTQAEENFRLTTKRYEANAATSFDVVDAEQLLTQARAQKETSLYDYLVARAALARAAGAPVPGTKTGSSGTATGSTEANTGSTGPTTGSTGPTAGSTGNAQ